MPKTERMRFATSPSLTAWISGIPPATAASNASVTPRRRASSYSSPPWWARSALLAVTTCLPAPSAFMMNERAGSSPPTSSTTMWIEGSASTRPASGVIGSFARSSPSRGRVRSVSATAARVSRHPARSSSIARRDSRILTTPAPTVPRPSNPILTSFISLDPAALSVDLDDLGHARLIALERDDAGDLDRLEGAVVQIGLDARQRMDHPGVAAHEGEPPAGHVVRLRRREDLDADLLRPRNLEERRWLVAVEREVGVRE